jgi:uncharacterized membrane protein
MLEYIIKMNKIIFVTAILVLSIFLIANVSATSIITIDLDNTGSAVFLGKTNENPILPEGIVLKDGKIYGFTSNLTSKQGDIWSFSFNLNNSQLTLVLPENSIIESLEQGKISDYGKRIAVSNFDSINIQYTFSGKKSFWWIYLIIGIFGLFLIIFGLYYYFKLSKKIRLQKSRIEIIKKVLNEREKLILDSLKKSGKIKMSSLRKLTEIPKASFSRHILELERKKLIKKSGEGKNKFIEILEK